MTMRDYAAVAALWRATPGMFAAADDSRKAIACYLRRNRGMSFVAYSGAECVGAVLGGHDGRRGYLHHVAVAESYRRAGTGSKLWQHATAALRKSGIARSHVFVRLTNEAGLEFWTRARWTRRDDIAVFSHNPQP
jgi:ribosomal protein S18 acetylase RimI-like enzyme